MSISKQKGSSTVEFALVLPILLLLIVMVSELGVMFYRLNAVTKSVQVAARYLSDVSVKNIYSEAQRTNAKNLAVYGNMAGSGDPIVPGFAPDNIVVTSLDAHVQVVATYDSNLILGNTLNGLMKLLSTEGGAADFMTLKASSVMRFAQ